MARGIGLVSIVIPCYNPNHWLDETIASVRNQNYSDVEIVLVNDGSDAPESRAVLRRSSQRVNRYVEQPNRGVSAARNLGMQAAAGAFIVPLDCQDILSPDFISACAAAIEEHPEAAFVYTDYRVFGDRRYVQRLKAYNLYALLDENTLPYASLLRAQDCKAVGGYDEAFPAHEDWELYLRLARAGRFGYHLNRVLWAYRKSGSSLSDVGRVRHAELVARIRAKHPELYLPDSHAQIKKHWQPSVCVVGPPPTTTQTICDWETVDPEKCSGLLDASQADTFVFPQDKIVDPETLELAALAAWVRTDAVLLPDGSYAVPRPAVARFARASPSKTRAVPRITGPKISPPVLSRYPFQLFETLLRHLANAELLSTGAWVRHPVQSAGRLIPLRFKEHVNRLAHRSVFDLTFYLRFQPRSLVLETKIITPVRYIPTPASGRSRIAFVTPHLGPGGAEAVLLDIARALDRNRFEVLLIATHSRDSRWLPRWRECVDHVYDLEQVVAFKHVEAALLSVVCNWKCDTLFVQNSLPCYNLIPHLKAWLPGLTVMDLVHAVGPKWDVVRCTAAVAGLIDTRIAISESARTRLRQAGIAASRIRLIRNGVDLEHFARGPEDRTLEPNRILFAGRLDPVKRPLLLVEIAQALRRLRKASDFRIVVAGDGPEDARLRSAVRGSGIEDLESLFEFLGHVPDLAPVLAQSALLVITSIDEGIPMVLLEALAFERPVVASNVGAIGEVLDETTGFLIERGAGEADAFATAIQTLLSKPDLSARMGRLGRQKVRAEYDRTLCVAAYRELFEPRRPPPSPDRLGVASAQPKPSTS